METPRQKQEQKEYSPRYLALAGLLGYAGGSIVGTLEGAIGSLAVPTSLRDIKERLSANTRSCFDGDEDAYDKLASTTYHANRIFTRLGIHATALYKAVAGAVALAAGDADPDAKKYALLLIPNLLSVGFELFQLGKRREAKKQELEQKVSPKTL